jgi:hypothetical protein
VPRQPGWSAWLALVRQAAALGTIERLARLMKGWERRTASEVGVIDDFDGMDHQA